MYEKEIEHNRKLVQRYPWLWPRDWNGNKISEDEYDFTWSTLDDMPKGWVLAFGEQMCQEIEDVLEKYNAVDEFQIIQLKEKYGCMRLYTGGLSIEYADQIDKIIQKYEDISETTCCVCGKPAVWISTGWICPFCDECADRRVQELNTRYPEKPISKDSLYQKLQESEWPHIQEM